MSDLLTISCSLSNNGTPCCWESGTENEKGDAGYSTIICNRDGSPKRAIFIKKSNYLDMDNNHALIPVALNDIVIKTKQNNKKFDILVYSIENINRDKCTINLKKIHSFSSGNWDKPIPGCFEEPVKLSKHKALTTLCSEPFYIKTK